MVGGFTKTFLGTLIERARDVQVQEALAAQRSLLTPDTATSPVSQDEGDKSNKYELSPLVEKAMALHPDADPEKLYLGPLQPDHLREAYRRFKRDCEHGGASLGGWSVGMGVPGAGAAKIGGRRLFR